MPLTNFIYHKIDPDRLIPAKTWLTNGLLLILTGLLLATALTFAVLGEKLVHETDDVNSNLKGMYGLGYELNDLLKYTDGYTHTLQSYAESGSAQDLERVKVNQTLVMQSLSNLESLVLPAYRPTFLITKERIIGILRSGDQVVEMRSGHRPVQAIRAALNQTEVENLFLVTTESNNQLMRFHADSLYGRMENSVGRAQTTVKNALLPLTYLSVVIFFLAVLSMAISIRQALADRRENRRLLSEQKRATEFARNLINVAPIGYHSLDADGIIIDINQTELDWIGYTKDEIVGKKSMADVTDEKTSQRIKIQYEIFKKIGYLKNFEANLVSKDGQIVPILINSKAIYDENGDFSHAITMGFNFTERKKLEEDLIAARQDAEAATRLKQLFMANMSHEIRTPLNAIIGFSNLMSRSELNPQLREYVDHIQTSGNNLLNIVNDILDFEKIRSGMLHIDQVEFDLKGLVHSVTTMMRPIAAEKQLALYLGTEAELPAVLIGDPMRLTQILVNLLGNAIKFTERGHVTLRVKTTGVQHSDDTLRVCFEVEDTGIGIPESEHTRIFERFTQASGDTTRKFGGTGLGLSLVKMITELLQGTVSLKSRVGEGSVFTVEIPFLKSKKVTASNDLISPEKPIVRDLSGFHVLLVEDNMMNRRVAELYLQELGVQVTQAVNGVEAVKCLQGSEASFDLILMDIQMPEMDGYQATRTIRTELGLKSIPIIAMTAHVLSGEREKVLALGMNGYLAKPINHKSLVTVLLQHLNGFWDESAMREHVRGNQDTFVEIATLFVTQFPRDLELLRVSLETGDLARTASIAHALKSSVAYTGFQASLGDLLSKIETEVRAELPDAVLLAALFDDLVQSALLAVDILKEKLPKENGK